MLHMGLTFSKYKLSHNKGINFSMKTGQVPNFMWVRVYEGVSICFYLSVKVNYLPNKYYFIQHDHPSMHLKKIFPGL
jgi:lipoprotein signal peptidase